MKRICEQLSSWRIWDLVWALFVLMLPLTSVPVIVKLVHSDVVAAPSALLLPILAAGCILPMLIAGKKIPQNASLLILFVIAGLISTLLSFFLTIPEYKGQDPITASISAVITLFIGFFFYLVTLFWHDNHQKLRSTFRLLTISGAVVCFWTLAQAFCWYKYQRYPQWMKDIQFTLSIGSLYRQRFVGFTLEPSWLAHQLNLLYLPFWFAASITGWSAFRLRIGPLTVERVMFLLGASVLFLTLSRVGLAAFLITAGFCTLVFVRRLIRHLSGSVPQKHRKAVTVLICLAVILILVCAAYGILRLLVKLDFRMAGLFDIRAKGRSDPVFYIAEKLSLAARFVYWDGGFSIFNRYPIFGVGLGHAGFYLPEMLNSYAYRLIEVRDLLYRSTVLLNIKSLWIRILAETGIFGSIFFFVWYLHSLTGNLVLLRDKDRLRSTAAWMGCFTLLAFLLEGFSLDTFALPYLWFSVGMSIAAGRIRE